MKDVFANYITHRSVQYLILGFALSVFGLFYLDLWAYWPWLLLVVASAPFYEWATHKYVLHSDLSEQAGWYRDFQIRLHHGHHLEPNNIELQFAPISAIIIMFVQLYAFYALVTWSLSAAIMPLSGSLAYYLIYEWIHLAHHQSNYTPATQAGQSLRDAHMRHHFHNENYNWGITNGLGDILLGTWKTVKEVPKSPTAKNISNYSGS